MSDRIELDLPLHPRHAATVRAVAASVAADAGFSIDEIDDLRLGVDEAVGVLTDVDGSDGAARLHVRFDVDDHEVRFAAGRTADPVEPRELDELAARILRAVVDEFGVDDGVFTVVKRAAGDVDA